MYFVHPEQTGKVRVFEGTVQGSKEGRIVYVNGVDDEVLFFESGDDLEEWIGNLRIQHEHRLGTREDEQRYLKDKPSRYAI